MSLETKGNETRLARSIAQLSTVDRGQERSQRWRAFACWPFIDKPVPGIVIAKPSQREGISTRGGATRLGKIVVLVPRKIVWLAR